MSPDDIYYSDTRGRNLFGYRVDDDSMTPQFRRGDIAVVNPNLSSRPGDYVVARLIKGARPETLLRRLGTTGALDAPSSDYPPLPIASVEILGRVVEKKRLYK